MKYVATAIIIFTGLSIVYGLYTAFIELYCIFSGRQGNSDDAAGGNDNVKRQFHDYM